MLGQRLRELRLRRNMTMKELGKRFGVAESTIAGYESGARKPDPDMIGKLAGYFGVSTDYLIIGKTDVSSAEVSPEEAEFLKWVDENLEGAFFYDFDHSPEDSKRQLMEDLRYLWEREKKQRASRDKN